MNTPIVARRDTRPALLRATPTRPAAVRPSSSSDFDEAAVDAESVVSGFALFGLLFFVCVLFAGCFDAGVVA